MVDLPAYFFLLLLCDHFLGALLVTKKFFPGCHPLGRCIRLCVGFHRYVVNGEEKTGKLVLVDRYKCCVYSTLFRQKLCGDLSILSHPPLYGFLGPLGMEKKSRYSLPEIGLEFAIL